MMIHCNKSETDKMAKEKQVKTQNKPGGELISPDKIKKEPEDMTPVSGSKPSSIGKTITVLTSPSSTKASSTQPKTILLVQTMNSRAGGIQSLLLPQGLRSLPTTTSDMSFTVSRAKTSTLLTVASNAGKLPSSTASRMSECVLTSASGLMSKAVTSQAVVSHLQTNSDVKSIAKPVLVIPPPAATKVCELTFNSRTIKADGTVCTLKEYLCNFCQYKVASQTEFHEHFMTHVFSCNYCSFRAFTRYEVLNHKREKHQGIAEELAGYEGLDSFSDQMSSILGEWHCQVPAVASTSTVTSGDSFHANETETAEAIIISPKPPTPVSSNAPSLRTSSSGLPVTVQSGLMSTSASLMPVNRTFTVSNSLLQTTGKPLMTLTSTSLTSAAVMGLKTTVVATTSSSGTVVLPVSTVKTTASIGKSNDNYFTYKIVHDAAGKVQAYECDVCSYRSAKINEIFAHASTHSLTDLMKSNNANVQWECFYCSFMSVLQANVVSHVIAKHPNKPIQLKRMVTNSTVQRSTRSVLLKNSNFTSESGIVTKALPSPTVKKEKNLEEMSTNGTAKKQDEADDGCMWGCYYCSVQSVDRNEIIMHLKKDHAQQKLVITRRRITHIPAPKPDGKPESVAETHGDVLPPDHDMVASERNNSDVQIGDIDSTDPQHSLLKSRRKQVFPRKVADDAAIEDVGVDEKFATNKAEGTETTLQSVKGRRRFQNSPKMKDLCEQGEIKQSEGTITVLDKSRRQRKSELKNDDEVKRIRLDNGTGKTVLKMVDLSLGTNGMEADAEGCDASNAAIVIDGQEGVEDASMPALEDVSNFIKLKPLRGKSPVETLLATEPTGLVHSAVTNSSSHEPDKEMPILHPELNVPASLRHRCNDQEGSQILNMEKPDEVTVDLTSDTDVTANCADDLITDHSKLFHFDKSTKEAHCNLCQIIIQGLNARCHMHEHVAAHTGGQLWTCPYCPFKCSQRSIICRHIQKKHQNRPVHLIRRRIPRKLLEGSSSVIASEEIETLRLVSQGKPEESASVSKLRGPRRIRERRMISASRHMWQCPYCGRRNVFKGALRIHIKVAHPAENYESKLKRMVKPSVTENQRRKLIFREAAVSIVPIEHMHHYESLGTLLLDNGVSLIRDLDLDDEEGEEDFENEIPLNRNANNQKFGCVHCHFRNPNLRLLKSHVLHMHPGEAVTIVTQRASSRKTFQLFMCRQPECSYCTNREDLLATHLCKTSLDVRDEGKRQNHSRVEKTIHAETQPSPETLAKLRTTSKSLGNMEYHDIAGLSCSQTEVSKAADTSGIESRQETANVSSLKKRLKTPEGPIDYNDDGTLKGIELEHGSVTLQCRYCDYPKTSDPVEIKVHLAAKHPRLQPIAIDVDAREKGGLACLFVCSVFGCDYSSHYSNVFEHHMKLEHPDVESVRLVKKKRTYKRISSEKLRIQTDVSSVSDKSEIHFSKDAAEEKSFTRDSCKSSDDNKDSQQLVMLASPEVSTLGVQSPAGTVTSEAANTFSDCIVVGSPEDSRESPISKDTKDAKETRSLRRPRSKLNFDYPCRYECIQCSFRIGCLDEMKSHLVVKHRENFRSFYCIDRRARELRKRQKVLFCHDERCGFYCKFEEELENHEKYSCTFVAASRLHQKPGQEGVLPVYVDTVVKLNSGGVATEGEKLYQTSRGSMVEDVHNKMYQCSHCTFITTDLHNIRMHVIAEHAATEGGFAEIKTELGTDGNLVMNVNDRGVNELVSKSALNLNLVCEKNVIRESRSMYDAVDTMKIDDEEKVYTVL